MAEFEDKLNSILSIPALMNQIMSMAGSMGQQAPPQNRQPQSPPPQQSVQSPQPQGGGMPFDPAAMQGLMKMMQSTQVTQKEMNLVRALDGFLPEDRRQKLIRAMQAAKIAKYASSAFSQGR